MAWSWQFHSAHQCQNDFLVQPYKGLTGPSLGETKKINDPSRKSRKWVNQFQTHVTCSSCRIYKRSQFVQRFWSIELPSNHMSQAQAVVPAKAQHGEICASFVVRKLVFPSCWIVLFACELWQSNRTLLEETWTPPTIDTAWTHWHALMSLIGQAQAGSLGRILMGWILPMKPTHRGRVFDVAKHAPKRAHINASTLFDMHTWQYTAYK